MKSIFGVSRAERDNLLKRCIDFKIALSVLVVMIEAVWRRFLNRCFRGTRLHYPKKISREAKKLPRIISKVSLVKTSRFHITSGPRRLKLAVGWLDFDDCPDWRHVFDDDEVFVSLHRWNWLLWSLNNEPQNASLEWGLTLVKSWILEMGTLPNGIASESYTVGERLSNVCIFLRIQNGNWESVPNDVYNFLVHSMDYLAQRVEYQPKNLTGNHVINNARGLMFAAHSIGCREYVDFSRNLLIDQLPKLISFDGFLREGSSHYQLLFTRWIVELWLLAAEKQDSKTSLLLAPLLPKLLRSSRFFIVKNKFNVTCMPMIGDISPDFEPQWLLDFPWLLQDACATDGWGRLVKKNFPSLLSELIKLAPFVESIEGWSCYPDAGWYRLDYAGWCAIWHAESSSGAAIGSHAHHDVGSLVLFYGGEEILVDLGRITYRDDSVEGNFGVSAHAHNTLCLGGISTMLSTRDRFVPECYREAWVEVSWRTYEDRRELLLEHNGFDRIGRSVTHTRMFQFTRNVLTIIDMLDGDGDYEIELLYHFASPHQSDSKPSEKFFRSLGISFSTDIMNGVLKEVAVDKLKLVWRATAYGKKEQALRYHQALNVTLPYRCEHRIMVT